MFKELAGSEMLEARHGERKNMPAGMKVFQNSHGLAEGTDAQARDFSLNVRQRPSHRARRQRW